MEELALDFWSKAAGLLAPAEGPACEAVGGGVRRSQITDRVEPCNCETVLIGKVVQQLFQGQILNVQIDLLIGIDAAVQEQGTDVPATAA